MTAAELKARLSGPDAPVLIHVLPEEIFAAKRIPGSLNACVFEIAFRDAVKSLVPAKAASIVVYGSGAGSMDSQVAAEILRSEGYTQVAEYEEGLAGWEMSGGPLEGEGGLPKDLEWTDGPYRVDTAASIVRWTGRNLFNHHSGTVRLRSGEIVLAESGLRSASFAIAMDSVACEDIADPAMNAMLIGHLHSADFFDVAHHPQAAFVARAAEAIPSAPAGSPNFLLRGDFTLRGVTQPLEFPIVLASAGPDHLTAQAQFDLDRTEFGSIYGSGKFFQFLGKHVVNDLIHLHVKIQAARA